MEDPNDKREVGAVAAVVWEVPAALVAMAMRMEAVIQRGLKRAETVLGGIIGIDNEEDDGENIDAQQGAEELTALMARGKRRNREERMIREKDLKHGKQMPSWMVHKAIGTLIQSRIEYDLQIASRGPTAEFEEEEQDFESSARTASSNCMA